MPGRMCGIYFAVKLITTVRFIRLLFLCLLVCASSSGQQWSKDRLERLKKAMVLVIGNDNTTGTGFFVTQANGGAALVTCWHVVDGSCTRDGKTGAVTGVQNLRVQLWDGSIYEAAITPESMRERNRDAQGYDHCILEVAHIPRDKYTALVAGSFAAAEEGDQLYTVGFPTGMKQLFLARGILSAKYEDTAAGARGAKGDSYLPRMAGLMDMTLNKGCSGGPVIKLGAQPGQESVIGIADFVVTPEGGAGSGQNQQSMEPFWDETTFEGQGRHAGWSSRFFGNSAEVIRNLPENMSGCIPIDFVLQ